MKQSIWQISLGLLVLLNSCSDDAHYSIADFPTVKKIDTHTHINTMDTAVVMQALRDNFKLLDVMVDVPTYPPLRQQKQFAMQQTKRFPNALNFLTAFSLANWDSVGFTDGIIKQLDSSFSEGALGVKIWKNIGMGYKDHEGNFIMVDDPRLDSIVNFVIAKDKTILGHLGEPKNCWLPLDQMTVGNDRNYFKNHPEYHMYLHPEFPSYEDQINARDRFVAKHPDMRFVGAHLGSLEWDVDALAERLDHFPNMAVDVAARIPHLQYQSSTNREKVRNFFIKYQDRIIYATDSGIGVKDNPKSVQQQLHATWLEDWKYFATDAEMSVAAVGATFRGLDLPRGVIDKLYRHNAVRWFKMKD